MLFSAFKSFSFVEKDDKLPNTICILCKYKLESFTTFRNVCIQSDETLRLTEIVNIKSEEIDLDDLLVKDECDNDSPMDIHDSSANYNFNECDSKLNIEFIGNENTSQLTQTQKEIVPSSCVELSTIPDKETKCKSQCKCHAVKKSFECNDCSRLFVSKSGLTHHIKSHNLKSQPLALKSTTGMEFLTNQRGNTSLTYLGFQYNKTRENKATGVTTWRCTQCSSARCKALIKTYENYIVGEPSAHTHDACPQKTEANIALSKMRESVKHAENIKQAIGNGMMGLNDDIVAHLPKRASIMKVLLRYKRLQTSKT
ncbi:uncharacterized protein LOC143919127 isoform X2 [Arctopsyche grandis]|uniref:uncharacterized protein LOC143919127 isoform X2 n=1 Tax=Arctopsyche grandis TaxID=121162 RepID=UPI00406D8908